MYIVHVHVRLFVRLVALPSSTKPVELLSLYVYTGQVYVQHTCDYAVHINVHVNTRVLFYCACMIHVAICIACRW